MCHRATNKNGVHRHAIARMNPQSIMTGERSQHQEPHASLHQEEPEGEGRQRRSETSRKGDRGVRTYGCRVSLCLLNIF